MRAGASGTIALALGLAVAGCRAVAMTSYEDMATQPDLAHIQDFSTDDIGPDMACAPGPEICNDGCDNDGNGYIDADDPACTPTLVAGQGAGNAVLWSLGANNRFSPFLSIGPWNGNATYRHDIVPGEAWVSDDVPSRLVHRLKISDGTETWSRKDIQVRDVCFAGGATILVEPGATSGNLHLLKPDGSDAKMVPIAAGAPAACASDGKMLYVPIHNGNARSVFLVFDAQLNQVAMIPMPASLTEDRCLDLAWTSNGFYGLFAVSGGQFDFMLSTTQAYPFAMDGGVGAPIPVPGDGGMVHSLGEFVP
jgi:hypothetical protein